MHSQVEVIEASGEVGGVACTLEHTFGDDRLPLNYGVQGGSAAAHQNTIELMREVGVGVAPCALDVSFGVGEHRWRNYAPSELQARLRPEIRRFGRVLRRVAKLEIVTAFVSIDFVLRVRSRRDRAQIAPRLRSSTARPSQLHRFSADFRKRMVYPLVALFFGTGNQTPKASPLPRAAAPRRAVPIAPCCSRR